MRRGKNRDQTRGSFESSKHRRWACSQPRLERHIEIAVVHCRAAPGSTGFLPDGRRGDARTTQAAPDLAATRANRGCGRLRQRGTGGRRRPDDGAGVPLRHRGAGLSHARDCTCGGGSADSCRPSAYAWTGRRWICHGPRRARLHGRPYLPRRRRRLSRSRSAANG